MEKVLLAIWEEFFFGGHLIALGAVTISLVLLRLKNYPVSWPLLVSFYLTTYIIYFADRYINLKNESSIERGSHFKKFRGKVTLTLSPVVILLVWSILAGGWKVLIAVSFPIIAGILYSLYFKNLTRKITGFKSFYTALTFASVVFFTTYYYQSKIEALTIYLYIFFALRWFANTIFCDIKDNENDQKEGLKTFSLVLGQRLHAFILAINVLSAAVIFFAIQQNILPTFTSLLILAPVYSSYYLLLSKKPGVNFQQMANIWADGETVVWFLAILIGGKLWG